MSTSELPGGSPFDVGALTELANAMFREHSQVGPAATATPASAAGSALASGLSPEFGSSLPGSVTVPTTTVPTSALPASALPAGQSAMNAAPASANVAGPHGRSPSGSLPSELGGLDSAEPIPGAGSTTGAVPRLDRPQAGSSKSPYYFLDYATLASPSGLGLLAPTSASALPGGVTGLAVPSSPTAVPTGVTGLAAPSSVATLPPSSAAAAPSPAALDLTSYVPASYLPSGSFSPSGYDPAEQARLTSGVSSVVTPALASHLDIAKVRSDFPILREQVNGKSLVWLDNAATTQKPKAVIERLSHFYAHENSNIHRAAHELAARSTDAYEGAREIVRKFLGARSTNEIVFVRGTTEGINLIASAWGRQNIRAGDEIVLSHLEHHANIVPWQLLAQEKGAKIRVIPVDDDGQILLSEYGKLLGPRTKIVSFTQVSNALGTITPAREMVSMAKALGITTLVDGAQSVSHMPTDVQTLGADFFVFSGHKVLGPTGIGAVWGREELLNQMAPYQGGGNMIQDVTFERTVFHPAPARFEAGTGNIADAVGLGAALEYLNGFGMSAIAAYEHSLLEYGTRLLQSIPGLRLIGTAPHKASVLSFTLAGFRTDEVSSRLNDEGIAVRGGHHCAQPILRRFGLESTVRPSLAFYNDCADLDRLAAAVTKIGESRSTKSFVP